MRKTILNASLEESTNLVTDKYIQVSMEDVNKKGVKRKVLGSFTMIFFFYLMFLLGRYTDNENTTNLKYLSEIMGILGIAGVISTLIYFRDIFRIKHQKVLSYYFYMRNSLVLVFIFCLQALIFFIAGTTIVLGPFFSIFIYGLLFIFVGIERLVFIKNKFYSILYHKEPSDNRLMIFLESFVTFSKKYGGIIIVIVMLLRFFIGDIHQNDIVRTLGLAFSPLLMLVPVYFTSALIMDNFQGYYLKKYLEDYRQLSGYSLEEWYGPKSKKYKESLKK